MPASKWSDNAQATSASSGSRWPGGSGSRQGKVQPVAERAIQQLQHAEGLLVELYQAIRELGEALTRAGFPASAWRAPEARLSTLSDRLPAVTLEGLLAQVADFAQETGPAWLARGGEALEAFAHEVQVLLETMRPLGALAQRQPTLARAVRGQRSLKLALQDERVGAQLDRLLHTLQLLLEAAPLLKAMPPSAPYPERSNQADATQASAAMAPGELQSAQEGDGAVPRWLLSGRTMAGHEQTPDAPPGARKGARWPGSRLLRAAWSRRRARVVLGVGLATLVLVLALTGTLALMHALSAPSASPPGSGPSGQALAPAPSGHGSTPSPAGTAATVPPTHAPAPAALAVRPGSVVLPCGGAVVTLTVSNSGGQTLSWQASVSGSARLSATSGAVGPGSHATVSLQATGTQHGAGAVAFASNGGTAKVSFKVSCH